MHQETWVHRHLQACNFVFDPGWRRLRRQWCIHQLFAGRFQDDGAYHKWRVNLVTRRACGRLRRPGATASTRRAGPPGPDGAVRRLRAQGRLAKINPGDELLLGRPDAARRAIVSE